MQKANLKKTKIWKKDLVLKEIFHNLSFGTSLKLNLSTIEISIFLFLKSQRVWEFFFFFFLKFTVCLQLALLIKEEILYYNKIFQFFFAFFNKKHFNNLMISEIKYKKIEITSKKIMKVINRFILKNIDFGGNIEETIFFFDNVLFPFGNQKKKNHDLNFFKNFFTKEKLYTLNYLFKIFGKDCLECGKVWLTIKKNCKEIPLQWWRILNLREAELEFFEQNFILIFSSSKFKKKTIRVKPKPFFS